MSCRACGVKKGIRDVKRSILPPARTIRRLGIALLLAIVGSNARSLAAQSAGDAAQRLASVVNVTIAEYAKGIDSSGKLISQTEYDEALGFLAQAREIGASLAGLDAPRQRALLDTLGVAAAAKRPAPEFAALAQRMLIALGTASALEMPTKPIDLAAGRRVFEASCLSCHGPRGLGDGPAAKGMTPPPPAIGSADSMAETSPALMYHVISAGVPGTKMPSWSALSSDERWAVVAYAQSLRATPEDIRAGDSVARARGLSADSLTSFAWQAQRSDAQLASAFSGLSAADAKHLVAYLRAEAPKHTEPRAVAVPDSMVAAAIRAVRGALDQSLAAAAAGRTREADDRAFDAYIAFEPLEVPVGAKDPQLVTALEGHFGEFKSAVHAGDTAAARAAREAIESRLPDVMALSHRVSDAWAAFLQSLLIIVREGFEAILVIGAIAAFLMKTGHRDRLRAIWWGSAIGVLASIVTAIVLQTTLRAIPASRDLLEGITMLIAVALLFSVSYWLISKVEAANWQKFIREQVSSALERGGGKALAFAAFLAVYREGAETALFYQALLGEAQHLTLPILLGVAVGGAVLAVIFTLFHRFGVRIPLRPFFAATSGLLYLMAFVMAGRGVHELQDANVIAVTHVRGVPTVELLGIFPTAQTLLAQGVLVAALVIALTVSLRRARGTT